MNRPISIGVGDGNLAFSNARKRIDRVTRSSGALGYRQTRVSVTSLSSPEEIKAVNPAHRIKPCLKLAPLKPGISGLQYADVTESEYAVIGVPVMLSPRFICRPAWRSKTWSGVVILAWR